MKFKLRYKEVNTIEGIVEADSLEEAKEKVKATEVEEETLVEFKTGVDIELIEEIKEKSK